MGKEFFTDNDIAALKAAEKAPSGRGGFARPSFLVGLGLIILGLFWAESMEGKTLRPQPTPITVAATAVSWQATPTLAPTATATPTASATATETASPPPTATQTASATAQATWTAQPTHTAPPTYTPQATWTPQPSWTPHPTATNEPTAVPVVETERPFLAPPAPPSTAAPNGDVPPWLIGSFLSLLALALLVLAYVSRQMRPIPPPATPGQLPPPDWQPKREPPIAPVQTPVTPVSPPGATSGAPVKPVQTAAPETIQVQVTPTDENADVALMQKLCATWNKIEARGERPSLNRLCQEHFGGKNSERMAIARRAIKWGREQGLIGNKQQDEVNHDPANYPEPTRPIGRSNRRQPPIPINNRRGRSVLN